MQLLFKHDLYFVGFVLAAAEVQVTAAGQCCSYWPSSVLERVKYVEVWYVFIWYGTVTSERMV